MTKCPNCDNKNLLYYPQGYRKEDKKSFFECTRCETLFDHKLNGGYVILKKGKDILME